MFATASLALRRLFAALADKLTRRPQIRADELN